MTRKQKRDLDEKLGTVVFHVDPVAHITVRKELCRKCRTRPCTAVCPAGNYAWDEEETLMIFSYEGCLECGTCKFICPLDAVVWDYPKGGFGVAYSWG